MVMITTMTMMMMMMMHLIERPGDALSFAAFVKTEHATSFVIYCVTDHAPSGVTDFVWLTLLPPAQTPWRGQRLLQQRRCMAAEKQPRLSSRRPGT